MFLELYDGLPRVARWTSFGACALIAASAFTYSARVHARAEQSVMCLAENLYHEARGESSTSQRLIGTIALARLTDALRAKRAPTKTLCGVVGADRQFSWTLDYKLATTRAEQAKWTQAVALSRDLVAQAMAGELTLPKGWACVRHYKRTDDKGSSVRGRKFFGGLAPVGQFESHTAYAPKGGCAHPFPTAS